MKKSSGNLFVLIINLLVVYHRIANKLIRIKIFLTHINGADTVIVICLIVINATVGVKTTGIHCYFVLVVIQAAATTLVVHTAENMKELTDALLLPGFTHGI